MKQWYSVELQCSQRSRTPLRSAWSKPLLVWGSWGKDRLSWGERAERISEIIGLGEGVRRRVKRNHWGHRENRRGGGKEMVGVDSWVSVVFVTF